ncbi:DUF1345 domain-containing protein [Microbacterium sp. GXS0129]|jgi:uncharacterized membrane protein|uniref:DUF1345 domain-containing protein n=1 Tax=Microbacterium sp. GXS0129 TaxID=3377836 RepID=UPI00383B73AC
MRFVHMPLVRIVASAIIGVLVGLSVGSVLGAAAGSLAGWGAAALLVSAWILLTVWPMDPQRTRAHAVREDPGRDLARVLSLLGSIVSLGAVVVVVLQSNSSDHARAGVLAAIAVGSVVATWILIQTDYMLRYARIYYSEPEGGIDFNEDDSPQYSDFAYFSVGLGMTYQVADTNVRTKQLRKVVTAQTMLAYLFGAVILGTVINLVTGLA